MTTESLIAAVREAATALTRSEPQDHEIADASGMVREIEVMLADWRRNLEKRAAAHGPMTKPEPVERVEKSRGTPDVVAQGQHWELQPAYRTTYSFNTPRLTHDFAQGISDTLGVDLPIGKVLDMLQKQGALELKWKVSKLRAVAKMFGVVINTGHDTIGDDADMESPHVGEVKVQTGMKRVPLKKGVEPPMSET